MDFKKKLSRLFSLIFALFFCFLLYQRIPGLYHNITSENKEAPQFVVQLLSGESFDLAKLTSKKVIVFWATWCGPCDLELGRLNSLIKNKVITKDDILAISIAESRSSVENAVKSRNYRFTVGLDENGSIANLFGVIGTPTVVFIDENKIVRWMTTGISPLLDQRVKNFIK